MSRDAFVQSAYWPTMRRRGRTDNPMCSFFVCFTILLFFMFAGDKKKPLPLTILLNLLQHFS